MIESRTCSIPNHGRTALQTMHELRRENVLCDVILCVDGERFPAHKIVLAGSSPYLKAMFTNGMLETEQDVVEIKDFDAPTMQCLLDFMYTSTIEITVNNVQSILQGASLFGLQQLRVLSAQFLQLQLTPSNCLGIQAFADVYMCAELERAARQFIYQNFLPVAHTEEFLQLSEEKIISLLRSDQLHVMSESQVFDAAYSWLTYDKSRTESACNILKHIKLGLLELPMLENVVIKSDFFRTCHKCQSLISSAIRSQYERKNMELLTPRAHPPCIYVVGGRNSQDCQLRSMERYDILSDTWSSMPGMNIARTAIGSATLDGLLYTVGGECALIDTQENTLYLRCMECYDPVQRQWLPKPEMKIARSFVALAAVGGYLYAIGGEDRACGYNVVERFDPRADQWSFVASMKRRRAGSGITVCEGKIYVAGGYDRTLHMDRASMECYDPVIDDWTFMSEMEKARSGLVMATIDQNVYAFGGRYRHTDQYYDMVERFNVLTRQWTTLAQMNTPRAWPGIAIFDGRIYVLGGFDGGYRLRSAESYDAETDQWTPISNMLVSRAGCGAAVV
ncbi:kelch-like ECH-associated protein 1 [Mya arenaria]|uniref:kelch-like ECH-associated protein 1 n=1 Tax=Mya arenaria TaxID=6604 RepID=UPI0022E137BC|nr:kelch-like ECH-associated protein 1 [Mya arenaria]